jgi:uncharacterized protein YaeQ
VALTSTIHKAELELADLDRGHFGDDTLTIARHPSEPDKRRMVRLLAFALNASVVQGVGGIVINLAACAAIDDAGRRHEDGT